MARFLFGVRCDSRRCIGRALVEEQAGNSLTKRNNAFASFTTCVKPVALENLFAAELSKTKLRSEPCNRLARLCSTPSPDCIHHAVKTCNRLITPTDRLPVSNVDVNRGRLLLTLVLATTLCDAAPRCPDPRLRLAIIGGDTITGSVLIHKKPLKFAQVRLYFSSGTAAWSGRTDKKWQLRHQQDAAGSLPP